jgi:hypothetical protein
MRASMQISLAYFRADDPANILFQNSTFLAYSRLPKLRNKNEKAG